MQERVDEVKGALLNADLVFGAKKSDLKDVDTYDFKHDVKDFKVYWDVRKGLIPIVGGARETGKGFKFRLQLLTMCCPPCPAHYKLLQFSP